MKNVLKSAALLLVLLGSGCGIFQGSGPKVILEDPAVLKNVRDACQKHDPKYEPALERLQMNADSLLTMRPVSVMDKSKTPPSGDKHDYMSIGPYWWPDPNQPNSIPYIRRDGEVNPEVNEIPDHSNLTDLTQAVRTLSLAYYLTGKEEYAAKAAVLLRTWFLNPDTKMNPNLNYGQAIKGITDGRGIGLIETRWFSVIVDAIGFLNGSKSWTGDEQKGILDWFETFLSWLQNSPLAHDENGWKNNHGVWFDVQFTSIALFTGHTDLAKQVIDSAKTKRIASQIEPDGRMPEELARTNALGYTTFNLEAFGQLADIARNVNIDLWNYQTDDGRGIKKALDWAIPYMVGDSAWTYQQIKPYHPHSAYQILKLASSRFNDEKYSAALNKIHHDGDDSQIWNLLYGY